MNPEEAMRRLSRENPVPEMPSALPYETIRRALTDPATRNHGQRRRSRARLARAGALGALVCAAVALALALAPTSIRPARAAAAVLHRLAAIAAAQPAVDPPAPGHYLHVVSTVAGLWEQGTCSVLVPERRELWLDATAAGRILQVPGPVSYASEAVRRDCSRTSAAMLRDAARRVDTWYAPGCYTLGPASELRGGFSDPRALLRRMHAIAGGPFGASADFHTVAAFLAESDASPALRAAIYRAAATIPGVRVLGRVSDRLGRRGLGLELVSHDAANPNTTTELIFDPATSDLLAERTAVTSTGETIGWGTYGRPTVVASIPARAPAGLTPICRGGLSYGRTTRGGVTLMTGRP